MADNPGTPWVQYTSDVENIQGFPIEDGPPADNEILVWNDGMQKFEFQAKPAGGSASTLNELTNVTITTADDNDFVVWDTDEWVNKSAAELGVLVNGGALGTPASGDFRNCTVGTNSLSGVFKAAVAADVDAGSATDMAITPNALNGSSPTFAAPALGSPASGDLINCTVGNVVHLMGTNSAETDEATIDAAIAAVPDYTPTTFDLHGTFRIERSGDDSGVGIDLTSAGDAKWINLISSGGCKIVAACDTSTAGPARGFIMFGEQYDQIVIGNPDVSGHYIYAGALGISRGDTSVTNAALAGYVRSAFAANPAAFVYAHMIAKDSTLDMSNPYTNLDYGHTARIDSVGPDNTDDVTFAQWGRQITNATYGSGQVTYTAPNHGLVDGDYAQITGITPTSWNISGTVIWVDTNTFKIASGTDPSTGGAFSSWTADGYGIWYNIGNHTFQRGDTVVISGASPAGYNGTGRVIRTTIESILVDLSNPGASWSSGGSTRSDTVRFTLPAIEDIPGDSCKFRVFHVDFIHECQNITVEADTSVLSADAAPAFAFAGCGARINNCKSINKSGFLYFSAFHIRSDNTEIIGSGNDDDYILGHYPNGVSCDIRVTNSRGTRLTHFTDPSAYAGIWCGPADIVFENCYCSSTRLANYNSHGGIAVEWRNCVADISDHGYQAWGLAQPVGFYCRGFNHKIHNCVVRNHRGVNSIAYDAEQASSSCISFECGRNEVIDCYLESRSDFIGVKDNDASHTIVRGTTFQQVLPNTNYPTIGAYWPVYGWSGIKATLDEGGTLDVDDCTFDGMARAFEFGYSTAAYTFKLGERNTYKELHSLNTPQQKGVIVWTPKGAHAISNHKHWGLSSRQRNTSNNDGLYIELSGGFPVLGTQDFMIGYRAILDYRLYMLTDGSSTGLSHRTFRYNQDAPTEPSLLFEMGGSASRNYYHMRIVNSGNQIRFDEDALAAPDGEEHSYVITFDNTTGTMALYIDGSVVDTDVWGPMAGVNLTQNTWPVLFRADADDATEQFLGVMRDFIVFTRTTGGTPYDAADVAAWHAGTFDELPKFHLPMDEGRGWFVQDVISGKRYKIQAGGGSDDVSLMDHIWELV